MAGEFNPGFHRHQQQQHGVVYKSSGGMVSSSGSAGSGGYEMIPMANYYNSPGGSLDLGGGDGSAAGMQYFSTQNNSLGPSSSSLFVDAQLYGEAYAIVKKFNLNIQAVNVYNLRHQPSCRICILC